MTFEEFDEREAWIRREGQKLNKMFNRWIISSAGFFYPSPTLVKKNDALFDRIVKKIEKLDAVYHETEHALLTDEKLYKYARRKWLIRSDSDNPPATACEPALTCKPARSAPSDSDRGQAQGRTSAH